MRIGRSTRRGWPAPARMKFVFVTVAVCGLLALYPGPAGAQVDLDPPLEEVVSEVEDTVSDLGDDVEDAVSSTTDSATGTVDDTTDGAVSSTSDSATATVESTTDAAGGASSTTSGTGGQDSLSSGGTGEASLTTTRDSGAARSGKSSPGLGGGSRPGASSRGQAQSTRAQQARAQAGTPLTILKTNDADRDGEFSDAEAASASGQSVTFRVFLMNFGSRPLRISRVVDSYPARGGPLEVRVCSDLEGSTLEPLDSVSCDFVIEGYSPGTGGVENVVTVWTVATEGQPTVSSDSDRSSVTTLDGTEAPSVLGEAFLDGLASTGLAATLPILAAALMVSGIGLLLLDRRRTRTGG